MTYSAVGRDSVVGIATRYGLCCQGMESHWEQIFCKRPVHPSGSPSLLYNGYRSFPGVKRRTVALTTHPIPSAEVNL